MKRRLQLRLVFIFNFSFFIFNSSHAQFAFIPDTNFRNFLLNNGFASCMVGNNLDTTCSAVVTATKIDCRSSNISDLTGIQYFDSLDTLWCKDNLLTFLPPLPATLTYLWASENMLTSLPALPGGLIYLYCSYNQLTSLPALPNGLWMLLCDNNQLTSLPSLPVSLISFYCAVNQLSTLPTLPPDLQNLECQVNQLSSLPVLPSTLTFLKCHNNLLTSLPSLPPYLIHLTCKFNLLTWLPPIPTIQFSYLDCSYNQITSLAGLQPPMVTLICNGNPLGNLSALPSTLTQLSCINTQLTSLPALPGLQTLNCDSNQISSLVLPSTLMSLTCSHNNLTVMPPLPPGLGTLYSNNNFLATLPSLPNTLFNCRVTHNLITSLPELPDSMTTLYIDSNPIACLPEIKTIYTLRWGGTNIECLPNFGHIYSPSPSMNNLELCQLTDSCDGLWHITGEVFFDADSNCVHDSLEVPLRNVPLALDSGGFQLQQFFTDVNGRYSFRTGLGNYTIRVDTVLAPYRVICPLTFSQATTLSLVDSMESDVNFGLLCRQGFDLEARSISPLQIYRPGAVITLYNNAGDAMNTFGESCVDGLTGSVQVTMDNLLTYISPAPGALTPSSVVGNIITWNIPDFGIVDAQTDFNLIVEVSTNAIINDTICVQLDILPFAGDNNPSNNSVTECQPVYASFDPNVKYMSPSGLVDTSQQWFTFTIFFQNVGNAPAEDIYILDTLDQNLDASTFTYLSSSHDAITQLLTGNILRFNYQDINLADSTTDEPGSHGYMKYKVKRKDNLPVNTIISNTAHIYFDFNPAVVTNTVSAQLALNTGVNLVSMQDIKIYPNPTSSQLTVEIGQGGQNAIISIEIRDLLGQKVYLLESALSKKVTIHLTDLSNGFYILRVNSETGQTTKKFLKQ